MQRFFAALCVLCFAVGCGMAEDERDEENRRIYVELPDEAFRKACLATCDLDADGRISRYEAQRILELSCPDAGIVTLAGIEEFTHLRSLDCSGNRLSTLDTAHNLSLEVLDCSGNALVSLNLRGLRALRSLDCAHNLLPSLDLSENAALTVIDCAGNRLLTLDVSGCASQIERLDTRYNRELTTLYVSALQRIVDEQVEGHTSIEIR